MCLGSFRNTKVQLVVTYNDHTIMYYPVQNCWRIDNPSRCIVIGRGMPRTYIPLDQIRSYDVADMSDQ
jgi:hypothetical protein